MGYFSSLVKLSDKHATNSRQKNAQLSYEPGGVSTKGGGLEETTRSAIAATPVL
jgi:hypothetical protein